MKELLHEYSGKSFIIYNVCDIIICFMLKIGNLDFTEETNLGFSRMLRVEDGRAYVWMLYFFSNLPQS